MAFQNKRFIDFIGDDDIEAGAHEVGLPVNLRGGCLSTDTGEPCA